MGLEIAAQDAENRREEDGRCQYAQGQDGILLIIRQKEFSAEKRHQCSDSSHDYGIKEGSAENAVCVPVLF